MFPVAFVLSCPVPLERISFVMCRLQLQPFLPSLILRVFVPAVEDGLQMCQTEVIAPGCDSGHTLSLVRMVL